MISEFVKEVAAMRDLQKRYFKAAAKSRQTGYPDDHKERKRILELSKAQERKVDQMMVNIDLKARDESQSKLFES